MGLFWRPRHNHDETALVLFADRDGTRLTAKGVIGLKGGVPIDSGHGLSELERVLAGRHIQFA